MLVTNQRLDKLTACCVNLAACGMLDGPCLALNIITVPLLPPPPTPPSPLTHDLDDDVVDRPRVLASVSLTRTQGKSTFFFVNIIDTGVLL